MNRRRRTALAALLLCLPPVMLRAQTPPAPDPQAAAHRERAKQLAAQGDYPGVIAEYQQAYALDRGAHLRDAIHDLGRIGGLYDALGQYGKALESLQQALPLEQQLGDRAGEATVLNNIGMYYDRLSQYPQALDYLQRALPLERQAGDEAGQAVTLNDLGAVAQSLNRPAQALGFYEQALPVERQSRDAADETGTLNGVGNCCLSLSRYRRALAAFQHELALERRQGAAPDQATTLNNLGMAYDGLSRYPQAIDFYGQALPMLRRAGNKKGEAVTLSNIGAACKEQGQYDRALEFYQQALPLQRASGDGSGEAITLNNIGTVEIGLGRYAQALDEFQQVEAVQRRRGDEAGEAAALNNMGGAYDALGQTTRALGLYRQALPIRRRVGDRAGEAGTLDNIGRDDADLGRPAEALGLYQRALTIERAIGNRLGEAATLNDIGLADDGLHRYAEAVTFYGQALAVERSIGAQDRGAVTSSRLGLAYAHLGRYPQALDLYARALPVLRQVKDRAGEAAALQDLMLACQAVRRPRLAVFYGKQSVNVYQDIRAGLQGLDRQTQRGYLLSVGATYRRLADLLIGQGRLPEAERVLSMLKGQEVTAFVSRDAALAPATLDVSFDPDERAVQARYQTLADSVTQIGQQVEALRALKDRTAEQGRQLVALQDRLTPAAAEFRAFLAALPAEMASAAPDGGGNAPLIRAAQGPLQNALRRMGPGVVALFTVVEPDRCRVVVVTSQAEKAEQFPIGAAALRRLVLAWRAALQDPRRDPRPLGARLSKILIGPVEADLIGARATTLLWSLDDVLRYAPVGALWDGRHYLVEKYRTAVFTGATLPALGAAPADWRGSGSVLLALGVTRAHTVTDPAGGGPLDFPALPGVDAEVRGIARYAGNPGGALAGTPLEDAQFTQPALRAALAQGYPVVHIASHFDLGADYRSSFLLLGDGGVLSLADLFGQGGQLFQGVDLLTLSACRTGVGGAGDGHEVESLAALAQEQGASSVLASLWPVSDATTPLLMRTFYQRLAAAGPGASKAEALRQAQLSLLRGTPAVPAAPPRGTETVGTPTDVQAPPFAPDPKAPYAHPYYWAPFVLIGDWR